MTTTNAVTQTNDFRKIALERRSIKSYDPSIKISREEMTEILDEATRAPSSINLQPWRFLVIESEEAKAQLLPLAKFNSHQVETSAAVIAIFGDLQHELNAEEIFNTAVELGYMPAEVKERQLPFAMAYYENLSEQARKDIALIDSGLVSMQLMLVARAHGYDTNPIGGYEKEKMAEVFGMDTKRYVPVMLLTIGKAANEGYPSMRLPINSVAEWK
ncbi:nitroreductase family protein [Paenibacillus bovis]|uniref:NAD(P)H nitroreductase n=1 Tax=Paenibacillus bovis TaxID=1616788 RepID=A0A172ZJU2_9BACL|nr:nitroreductase family protein [Paenibacillus bovis]ANF97915.1 NAD(P)H nitroreductase [Paenibacillus bovis]